MLRRFGAFLLAGCFGTADMVLEQPDSKPEPEPTEETWQPGELVAGPYVLVPTASFVPKADAGGTVPVTDAGQPLPMCPGSIVNANFEGDTPGALPTGFGAVIYPANGGTVKVDTTRAFSGTKSVKIVSSLPNIVSHIQLRLDLPPVQRNMFGRMRVWATRFPSVPRHWDLISAFGYVPGTTNYTIADMALYCLAGSKNQLDVAYVHDRYDCCVECGTSPHTISAGRWTCVEWQFDTINHQMRFWLDGQGLDSLAVNNPMTTSAYCNGIPWTAPKIEQLKLGWSNAPAESVGPMEMWIDDVAVDTCRIGCGDNP